MRPRTAAEGPPLAQGGPMVPAGEGCLRQRGGGVAAAALRCLLTVTDAAAPGNRSRTRRGTQSLSPFHVPTLQLALRFRESFAYDLGLRASRWVMATLEGAAAAAWRVLLGWRARLSRWRVAGMAPREASSEAGEVELQTVQLTAADSAATDAAPSEASFEGGA